MNMNTRLTVAALALAFVGNVDAACKQQDAKGTWITYQAAFLAEGPHVGQCKLIVDKAGNVTDQGSYCEFITFNTPQLPTDGTFKVNKDCSAEISLSVGNLSGQVQLTKNKQMYAGRFSAQGGTVSGTTTGVKQ